MEEWFPTAPEAHNISKTCLIHAYKTFINLMKGAPWAIQMVDASSKIPSGLLKGNIYEFGNYDECLQVDVKENWGTFIGRHCMVMLAIPTSILPREEYVNNNLKQSSIIPYLYSVCVPSTCTATDLQYGASWFSDFIIVDPMLCHTRESPPLEPKEWTAIGILSFIGILCLLSTIYDLLVTEKGGKNQLALVFSWYSNGKGLFSTKVSPDSITVLNGIRFLSIFLIVVGHVSLFGKVQPSINYTDYMQKIRQWDKLFVTNAPMAVDTFFVIGGLVLSYVFMQTMDDYRRFNLAVFYMHRILRVLPVLATIVMINSTILHRFGDGPLWDYILSVTESKYCAEYWWSTILFIQNYVNTQCNCVLTSWFLAVDMQLYWISPIFLLALYKRPRLGFIIIAFALILGIIIAFVEAYTNEDTPNNAKIDIRFDSRYYYTHTRYVTWLMGVAGGYILYKTRGWLKEIKSGTIRLSKIFVTAGWLVFAVLSCIIFYAIYPFEQIDYVYSPVEAGFYFAFTRPLWGLCILWLIFACEAGYGGILNSLFSWPGFYPLGRLTFCIYILHFDVGIALIFSTKLPVYNSIFAKGIEDVTTLVITILLAIVLTLSVEAPFISLLRNLQRIFAGFKHQSSRKEDNNYITENAIVKKNMEKHV